MATETIKKIIEVEIQSDQARQESARLTAQLAKQREEQAALTKALKLANAEYGENSDQAKAAGDALAQNRRQVTQTAAEIRRFNKELDTNSNSLNAARMKLAALNKEFDNLDQNAPDAAKRVAVLTKEIEDLTQAITQQEQATGRFQRNVGNYAGGIREAFGKGGLGGALDAAKGGLMAIPQLAAAAFAFDAVRQGVQQIEELNKRIRETQTAVTQLTGAQGEALETQTATVQALANAYGKDFKETLIAVNAVSKGFGEDFSAVLANVERGFRNGGDANGEFLDQLREYPAVFKGAGISATQFIDIITQSAKEGIYSDKGIDALKEGALTLTRDLTPAAEKALAAIGLSGKELQDQIRGGELSTFEALQKVSNQLATLNPASKEYGNVVSEVFRGAGEDAGQFVAQLGKIKVGFEDTSEQAKDMGLIFQNEVKLEELTQRLGDSTKGIGKFMQELKGYSLDVASTFFDVFEGEGGVLGTLKSMTGLLTGNVQGLQKMRAAQDAADGSTKKLTGGIFGLIAAQKQQEAQAKKEEADDLRLLGLTKAQIEEIQKQKANTEALTAVAAKYGLTLDQVTKATKKDTEAREKNNEAIATGTTLLDEMARAQYEARQAQIDQVVTPIGERDFGGVEAGGTGTTPDIGNARVAVALDTEAQLKEIRQRELQATTDQYVAQLDIVMGYASEVGSIINSLSNLWATNQAAQLQQAAGNEEKQLEINRKFAKRQAILTSVQVGIDGIAAVQKALASSPPPINFILAGVQTGLAVANVAAVLNSANKFADGGMVGGGVFDGPRHSGGGVKFAAGGKLMEAEGGEAILTRRATSMFRPMLSAMNQAGGGRKFEAGGTIGASASVMAGDPFAAAMRSAIASMPPPQVAVQEIITMQNRVLVKEDGARL